MKVILNLVSDSYNTYTDDTIELMAHKDQVFIQLEDREISVRKKELLDALELLCK